MAVSLSRLPKYLVLEPVSTVRLEIELTRPSCEIDVELQNPQPGRSFVLLIGQKGGPHLQRMRLTGRARVLFDPKAPGVYVLMLANPQKEPLVLRLRGRNLKRSPRAPSARARTAARPRSNRAVRTKHAAAGRTALRVETDRRTATGRAGTGPKRTAPKD